tara:strand:+ start:103 stop:405 length:303 start_codon:yes stop_codon:yes gene_type:complete
MKVGDLVMKRIWVGDGILVGNSGGKWIDSEDVGILVGFDFAKSPRVLVGTEVHTFTRESVAVLSHAIKAVPGGEARGCQRAKRNSAENFPFEELFLNISE